MRSLIITVAVCGCAAAAVLPVHALGRGDKPPAAQTPIEHVVIVQKENRSYDELFGAYPQGDGATTGVIHTGEVVPLTPAPDPFPQELGHEHTGFLVAYDNGKNDGFDLEAGAYTPSGVLLPYVQESRSSVPAYWAYADTYALGDRFFSAWQGSSMPNNLFGVAAQSGQYDP